MFQPSGPSGYFIAVEGMDGCGKSSVVANLSANLSLMTAMEASLSSQVRTTVEPGGTWFGSGVLALMLGPNASSDPLVDAMLYAADRREHIVSQVKPALDRGQIVITERYVLAHYAYNGYGHGVHMDTLQYLNNIATDGLMPDLTIVIDADPAVTMARRDRETIMWEHRRRNEDPGFNTRVRQGFLETASWHPNRIVVVNGNRPLAAVLDETWQIVQERLTVRAVRPQGS